MSIDTGKHWKTPVWKVSKSAGQLKRILRVSEAWAVIRNVDIKEQGRYKIMDIPTEDLKKWFRALLLSGMRLSELIRLKQNPFDNDGNPLLRENGSILLPYERFGLAGKQKIVEKERVVSLSYLGRDVMKDFLDKYTKMPRFKSDFNAEYVHVVFDAILKNSAEKIGLPTRTFTRTQRRPVIDDITKQQKFDEKGKPKYEKIVIPQTTTGVFCRSFRSSWESWLMTARGKDEFIKFQILKSIGHTQETAVGYYLASEFDDEDIADMLKITEGFGSFKKEREDIK